MSSLIHIFPLFHMFCLEIFQLLRQHGHHAKIYYEYSVPKTLHGGARSTYDWRMGAWDECNAKCGQGKNRILIGVLPPFVPKLLRYNLTNGQGRIYRGGQGGHDPPGGREVPQLIEGSETYQPEVKASKSDKRL